MRPFCLDKLFLGLYCNQTIMMSQDSKSGKRQKLSPAGRLLAAALFGGIAVGAAVLWASANGYINLKFWLGVCGFKQRFGLPCPGCGWTHAGQAFFSGHPILAFMIQPAAAFFCVVAVLTALFALHCAVFGINFDFPRSLLGSTKNIGILLILTIVVILAGWAVTLTRAILENSGH